MSNERRVYHSVRDFNFEWVLIRLDQIRLGLNDRRICESGTCSLLLNGPLQLCLDGRIRATQTCGSVCMIFIDVIATE